MTRTIELTPEQEAYLEAEARAMGVGEEEALRRVIATVLKPRRFLTPQELLRLPPEEQDDYIRAAVEDAVPFYNSDMALPPQERELTALSTLAGEAFCEEGE